MIDIGGDMMYNSRCHTNGLRGVLLLKATPSHYQNTYSGQSAPCYRTHVPSIRVTAMVDNMGRYAFQEQHQMELTEAERGYLAGLMDSEGCINISCSRGKYYVLRIIIVQANEHLLDYWQKKTNLGVIHIKHQKQKPENISDSWQWHLSGSHALSLLNSILPYLILKKQEALIGLEFAQMCHVQQAQYWRKGRLQIPEEMLKSREAYKIALHELKRERYGAKVDKPLTVDVDLPEPSQINLF